VNVAAVIEGHPADSAAIVSRGEVTTYGTLREQVGAMRGGLHGIGLEPGDQVAIACGTNWYFVVSFLAVTGAGLVAVPVNPTQPAAEMHRQLGQVRCRAAVVGPTGARSFSQVDRAALPTLEHLIVPAGVMPGAETTSFDYMLRAAPEPVVPRLDDDLAVLLFTSGTAGASKAAMLTHGNLLANLRSVHEASDEPVRPDDVALCVVPLFHILGLNPILLAALRAGARVVLVERFDPASAVETIARRGVTLLAGPPPMWTALANQPDATSDDLATLRVASSGAAALPRTTFDRMRDRFGLEVAEGYGLTEASPVVTVDGSGGEVHPGSVGRPVPTVEVRLVDGDGHDALVGDAGEIWVKGPNVFKGYWEDPEATAHVLTPDGWLRTGDIAVADGDGRLYLVDRAKDLIIVSGFNVYPAEVEEVLAEHPAVEQAMVVGHPDATTGEAVVAHVVVRPGTAVEEDDIIAFCADRLARYKAPAKVWFHGALPVTASGKAVRRELTT
jgi:long-chain acyl-CoA synthetase